jgi:hypothetical protein
MPRNLFALCLLPFWPFPVAFSPLRFTPRSMTPGGMTCQAPGGRNFAIWLLVASSHYRPGNIDGASSSTVEQNH